MNTKVNNSSFNKIKDYDTLIKELEKCKLCKAEFGFDPHPIILGNQNSKIVQISQTPSKTVHKTLKPFTDQSGKRLKYEWYQITDDIFYNPDNFNIMALSHCYPGKDKNGNDKIPPKICYERWVKKELEYINNEIYILIGARSAKTFFPNEKYEDLVFKDSYINGKLTIVLPHPSPLNIKWFKDHSNFINERLPEIRKLINDILKK